MVQRPARFLDVEDGAEHAGAERAEVEGLLLRRPAGTRRAGSGRWRRLRRLWNLVRGDLCPLLANDQVEIEFLRPCGRDCQHAQQDNNDRSLHSRLLL
jgi:hypothetical protein